jgi:hypothetical protein
MEGRKERREGEGMRMEGKRETHKREIARGLLGK